MCHDVSVITDRVKIVALRKCSRRVSGAAIVRKKKWCTWFYSAKTPVGEPNMDEWKSISSREAVQRFMMLIILCIVIIALIVAAVWYIA